MGSLRLRPAHLPSCSPALTAPGPPAPAYVLATARQAPQPTARWAAGPAAPASAPPAPRAAPAPHLPPTHPAVCRLPALGKLFMLHLGPKAPPGQEDAVSSGAFRVQFNAGAADA